MKNMKTYDEFVDHMWKIYPEENQLRQREAMEAAWNFMSGRYDQEQVEMKKIYQQIGDKMKKNGFT